MPMYKVRAEDYRLNRIEFENYKAYSTKQVLDLTTKRKFSDDITTERKPWSSKNIIKYKKIEGIWGKNASGKSSFVEVLARWDQIFGIVNQLSISANSSRRNLIEQNSRIDRHIKNGENPHDVFSFSPANDPSKPITISLVFDCKGFQFKYTVFERSEASDSGITHMFADKVEVLKNEKTNVIWDSSIIKWPIPQFLNFVDTYTGKTDPASLADVAKLMQGFTADENQTTIDPEFISNAIQNSNYLLRVFSVLNLFHANNLPIVNNGKASSKEETMENIELLSSRLHNYFNVPVDNIERVIKYLIKTIDTNVSDVKFRVVNSRNNNISGNKDTKDITISALEGINGNRYFPEDLSQGTVLFIDIFLSTWCQKLSWLNEPFNVQKYLFIDELGQNWHTNLSIAFINLIASGILGNVTLIFTSHDANIGDYLSPDCIWMINNESNLKRADDVNENLTNEVLRRNKKFSSDYLNDAVDLYSTNPDLDDVMNVGDLMDAK